MSSTMPHIKVPKEQLQCTHPPGSFSPLRSKTLTPAMRASRNESHIPLLIGHRLVLSKTPKK